MPHDSIRNIDDRSTLTDEERDGRHIIQLWRKFLSSLFVVVARLRHVSWRQTTLWPHTVNLAALSVQRHRRCPLRHH